MNVSLLIRLRTVRVPCKMRVLTICPEDVGSGILYRTNARPVQSCGFEQRSVSEVRSKDGCSVRQDSEVRVTDFQQDRGNDEGLEIPTASLIDLLKNSKGSPIMFRRHILQSTARAVSTSRRSFRPSPAGARFLSSLSGGKSTNDTSVDDNKRVDGPLVEEIVDSHPFQTKAFVSKKQDATREKDERTVTKSSTQAQNTGKVIPRLPQVSGVEEFPHQTNENLQYLLRGNRRRQATWSILRLAADRLADPPTLHLLAASVGATLGISVMEGALMCQEWPSLSSLAEGGSWETPRFLFWYSVEQVLPSIVWTSQDPLWVARSLGQDPSVILRDFSNPTPEMATTLLRLRTLEVSRYLVAGFMMIASIVRAAGVSAGAFVAYEKNIENGRQPPLSLPENISSSAAGSVIRLCGQLSYTTEVSLQRMGCHLVPIFENPDRVKSLVWSHSEGLRTPVYWCVPEGKYGSAYSWNDFPTEPTALAPVEGTSERMLILEADATNPNDPLALGNSALDLTFDEASQGFRRIEDRFKQHLPDETFRTLRVYLGNSMEISQTGGGYAYTLRHRIKYAKEVDVLIDSRAPVLQKIIDWCRRVAGEDKRLFFQTSSREYFLSLQRILRCYGYEIYDPLILRGMRLTNKSSLSDLLKSSDGARNGQKTMLEELWEDPDSYELLQEDGVLEFLQDSNAFVGEKNSEMQRHVVQMLRLPRLVHMPTTAETVNAVEALINSGKVTATNCCAIMERQEGVMALESVLHQHSNLVKSTGERYRWVHETSNAHSESGGSKTAASKPSQRRNGLQLICTSSIYDELFSQVRIWSRMGFSSNKIQREIDLQFCDILDHVNGEGREAMQQVSKRAGATKDVIL